MFSVPLTLLIPSVQAATTQTAVFRPTYPGMAKGTAGPYVVDPFIGLDIGPIDREINLEAWTVSQLVLSITWALPDAFLGSYFNFSDPRLAIVTFPAVRMDISTDRGATYTQQLYYLSFLIRATSKVGDSFTGFTEDYAIPANYYQYFGPDTRIKLHISSILLPFFYLAVNYIGSIQRPVPPYDYIDGSGNYVQYDMPFTAEYTEQAIVYNGPLKDFSGLPETRSKLKAAGDAILNTMHLSGASNEVTDKKFGTDTFIVIYSSQIAFAELLKLRSVIEDSRYIPAARRFVAWMWSKQNLTDGSFPFVLTDGDQHPWYNATTDQWYGRDKIDSFSACAITLMKEYYDATGDIAFVNHYWSQILKAKDFLWGLIDPTYGIPVDGYHYTSATAFYKSTWNWLHDSVEAYQGLKDYAYLEGVRGNPDEQAYFDGEAEIMASNIRLYFWNESLGRYTGMFNVATGAQDVTLVYNIITPLIYGIETNVTRSAGTLAQYLSWGLLSGRYLNNKWAADFEVTNEYSTMSGMIFAAYAQLVTQFGYSQLWMKNSYIEVTKFLFNNPIYPNKNLQDNSKGFLDWVDLVNYRWAPEYARLVETSAWFIRGFIQTPNMTSIFKYSRTDLLKLNQSLTSDTTYWITKYAQFKAETSFDYNSPDHYNLWVNWTKSNQLYVQWFDYMFLKQLYEKGVFDPTPLDPVIDDITNTTDEIWELQEGGLVSEELDSLAILLGNVTSEMERAKVIIMANATAEQKDIFMNVYYYNITQKVDLLQVKIINAKLDGNVTQAELDDIEVVKLALLSDLEALLAWLKTIEVPWWEIIPDPEPPIPPYPPGAIFIPIMLCVGVLGLIMVAFGFLAAIYQLRHGEWTWLAWGFLLVLIGAAFVIAWLWS